MALFAVRWLASKLDGVSRSDQDGRLSLRPQRSPSSVQSSPYLPEDATPESMYHAVKDLIILCMTDTVYTIRTGAIPLVAKLLDRLSLNTVLRLLDQVIDMCKTHEKQNWEQVEGLLNTLGLLIKRALPTSNPNEGSKYSFDGTVSPGQGISPLLCPPALASDVYLSQIHPKIQTLVFQLFDHQQPSVRIGAVNLFSTCLKRCPQSVIEKSLDEIMSEVCVVTDTDPVSMKEEQGPSLGVNATESLLSLCQILVRLIGNVRLPPSTGSFQNSLIQTYLGHSNTNVRMAACQVYGTLILSALENQNRVRYLLSRILENWSIRQDVTLAPLQKIGSTNTGGKAIGPNPPVNDPGPMTNSYESRLNICGLIAHIFVQRHFAVLYCVLVRGNSQSDGSDMGTIDDQITPEVPSRVHRNFSMKTASPLPRMDSIGVVESPSSHFSRSGSIFASMDTPTGHMPKLASFLPSSSKKSNTSPLSILDRYRMTDEAEKMKQQDHHRSSTWRSELARRLTITHRKPTTRSGSTVGGTEAKPDQTKLRPLLNTMLYAACENLVAVPRDLRQSARKTFPEVARLFCWFDAETAFDFICTNLVQPPRLMSYAALKILRASLDELSQYEKLVISGEDYVSPEVSPLALAEMRGQTDHQYLDTFPDGYFLNVPLLRLLFHPERSALWLKGCQAYLSMDDVPTFVVLPTIDCAMTALSLIHRLPQFVQAARYTESVKPSVDKPDTPSPLNVDPNLLVDVVRLAVRFVTKFVIVLDERMRPTSLNNEHMNLTSLRPFPLRHSNDSVSHRVVQTRLVPFLSRLIHNLEKVLFYFLPPSANPPRPGPVMRRTAGILLAPCLLQITTWPLCLLPPTEEEKPAVGSGEKAREELRVLAVRKLLRIIASIVHALPQNLDSSPKEPNLDSLDPESLPLRLEAIVNGRVDVTRMVNGYFTQLETILAQLADACSPLPLHESSSWWWFRALCEHIPRLMQVAPHANPSSFLRHLLDEVGTTNGSGQAKSTVKLWKRAITFARQEAAKSRVAPEEHFVAAEAWATTIGQLMRSDSMASPTKKTIASALSTGSSSTGSDRSSRQPMLETQTATKRQDSEESLKFGAEEAAFVNANNPAFDYVVDETELLVLDAAEPDSSSSEEVELTTENGVRKRSSIVQVSRRRNRYNSSYVKAQPLETPPALPDVVGLVQRVWVHCEPVTVKTLKNLLTTTELAMIRGENESPVQSPRGSATSTHYS